MEDCDFSGQGDDSLNIHGKWLTLSERNSPTSIVLTRVGPGLVDVGARLRVVRPADLAPYAEATVAQVTYNGTDRYTVTLQQPLPDSAALGDLVQNVDRNNSMFIVRRNAFHDHRGRGMLIQAPNGIIEDNVVRDVTMAGIHLTTDNNPFRESGALENVTLRRNTFIRGSYGSGDQYAYGRHMGCVSLIADVPGGIGTFPVHQNITIEDNVVIDTPGLAFLVGSSDRVLVRNNTIVRSNQLSFADRRTGQEIDAPARGSIMITRASNVTLTGNRQILTTEMFDSGIHVDPRNTSNVVITPAADVPDSDVDGLPDTWEAQFGLSPVAAAGSDGGSGDPDADGMTNVEELAAGTHPRGFFRRYLAEGALNSFFDVRLALLNVGTHTANVLLRFLAAGRGNPLADRAAARRPSPHPDARGSRGPCLA